MIKKYHHSREALDRKNERRRTYNAFWSLNVLIFQFRISAKSSTEAQKDLRNTMLHYHGRIEFAKREPFWVFAKQAMALMEGEPQAEELNTLQMDVTRVILEMSTEKLKSTKLGENK